jgi:hypothetical protein
MADGRCRTYMTYKTPRVYSVQERAEHAIDLQDASTSLGVLVGPCEPRMHALGARGRHGRAAKEAHDTGTLALSEMCPDRSCDVPASTMRGAHERSGHMRAPCNIVEAERGVVQAGSRSATEGGRPSAPAMRAARQTAVERVCAETRHAQAATACERGPALHVPTPTPQVVVMASERERTVPRRARVQSVGSGRDERDGRIWARAEARIRWVDRCGRRGGCMSWI